MAYRHLRPWLFALDPERAHTLTLDLLRVAGAAAPLRAALRGLFPVPAAEPIAACGLRFPNSVGLAAGYDKDALAVRGLSCLGFGHIEIGTVTPRPQAGNARPRLWRLAGERSLINRLGFPSRGADFVAGRLDRLERDRGATLVGVNIGKQRDTPLERAVEDYGALVSRFAPLADFLTVNVSSPNTPGLRDLQQGRWLGPLLASLVARRDDAVPRGSSVPLWVKLSPDLSERELDATLDAIGTSGVDGIVATNTTTDREGLRDAVAAEPGGLSGAALTARSTAMLRRIRERTGGRVPLVGCGGVMSPADAAAKLEAGASLVQVYTGLVFEGPGLAGRIVRDQAARRRSTASEPQASPSTRAAIDNGEDAGTGSPSS